MFPGMINLYTDFSDYGGAQNVAINLHLNLYPQKNNFLMGFTKYREINKKYPPINNKSYLHFSIKNIIKFKKHIFISHHRKITTYLVLLNKLFLLNLKIIHVAHNEFNTLKYISIYPEHIIAVSNRVKNNLVEYFKIDSNNITVIRNGIKDRLNNGTLKIFDPNNIKILYPARINNVKQQVKIVEFLKNRLSKKITIDFVGDGEDKDKLNQLCKESTQFNFKGFVNIDEIIDEYDFVMLFSKNEGLPLSLIEACMFQKPILANDVGGNLEILNEGHNGFMLSNFESLPNTLSQLHFLSNEKYQVLAHNSRQIFETKFLSEKMYTEYRNIIEKMIL
jgi:glycosyltransferase involved in cell wall biosynthesis